MGNPEFVPEAGCFETVLHTVDFFSLSELMPELSFIFIKRIKSAREKHSATTPSFLEC